MRVEPLQQGEVRTAGSRALLRLLANPHLLSLLIYALLTGVMTWPLLTHFTTAIPGDSFDGWQNYWNLWWIRMALVEHIQHPFQTDLLYYPTGVGLYFHTLNPFNGLATLPVQLSSGMIPAYNAVVLISWVLGGYGIFLLALWVLGKRGECQGSGRLSPFAYAAAFLAGLIFTFAPFHMAHLLGHMQVMSLQWMPFYVLYLLRASDRARLQRPWRRDGLLAGLFLVLVGLCDWYYVLYLFLFTAFFLLWQVIGALAEWRRGRGAGQGNILRMLLAPVLPAVTAGLVFLILLSPVLIPMVREALRFSFMERPASDLYILSATVADFLIPNRLHTLFRPESFAWMGNQIAPVSERTIAIGYLPLLLALAAAWLDRRRSAFWLVSSLVFLLIALGPSLHLTHIDWETIPDGEAGVTWTPYGILNWLVPFMRISRSVSRFAVMVQMAVAVAAAIGLAALLYRLRRSGAVVVATLACVIVLAEYWVAPYPISPPDTPEYYTQIAAEDGDGALLNLPMNYDRPGYLLYQTIHQKPLSVAYISRDDPRTLTERAPVLQHLRHLGPDILAVDPVEVGQTVFHDLGIRWIVLDRYKMPGGLERSYTTELAEAIFAGQAPRYEDERITVYHVQPPEVPRAYPLLGATGWGSLRHEEASIPGRTIGRDAAAIHLYHTPPEATITIHYRTLDDETPVYLSLPARPHQAVVTLPPAVDGRFFEIGIHELLHRAQLSTPVVAVEEVVLNSGKADGATIHSVELRLP
jgi:hypothetical protein